MKTELEQKIHEFAEQMYEAGCEDGQSSQVLTENGSEYHYQRGLNDAWECARKILNMPYETYKAIFTEDEDTYWDSIHCYSASEAIAKIKEYEEKQKQTNDEIKVGDEVIKALKQEPKTGHWIYAGACKGGNYDEYECSECGQIIIVRKGELSEFKGCYCGAKMVKPQESEG